MLDLLFFLFLRYLLAFGEVVVVIATTKILYIHVSFSIFAKFADYTFFFLSLLFCYFVILAILAIVIWVSFCCNEISCSFCDFCRILRFPQAISIKHIFAKIATQICEQSLSTVCNTCWICYFCYICYFFYTFLTVRLIFLSPKLRKQFATKFLRQCWILDIRGEPQGSH